MGQSVKCWVGGGQSVKPLLQEHGWQYWQILGWSRYLPDLVPSSHSIKTKILLLLLQT